MPRLLIAAAVLLAAAYFYLKQDGGDTARPLETQQRALEEAKAVNKAVQDQAAALRKQIDAQTGSQEDDTGDDDERK